MKRFVVTESRKDAKGQSRQFVVFAQDAAGAMKRFRADPLVGKTPLVGEFVEEEAPKGIFFDGRAAPGA
jgi:hypothetical protein